MTEKVRERNAADSDKLDALEAALAQARADHETQEALSRAALAEARQAASEALQRMSAEKRAADEARTAAREALETVKHANASALNANELVTDQQEKAASQMAKLLAEQREALTDELMRLRDEKDAEIAALKKQLKMLVEKGLIKEVAKPDPPSKKAPPRAPDQKGFVLVNDGRSIAEQLREQVEKKGLKVMDLFRLMDEDNDGTINKKDWTKAMSKIGPDFPKDALDKAFDEADPDNSNSVEYKELEGFIKGRKPSAKPIEVKQKKGLQKRVKPSLLAALATSMGVKPELIADAMDTVGKGEDDFEAMMKARAEAFGAADLDFDGKLDYNEFKTMVKARETAEYTEKQLKAKFEALDLDGSGKIDQFEFITFSLRDALKRSKGKAIDIFRIWDEDNSGEIDKDEFTKALVALGFCCSKQDSHAVFDLLDEDKSGTIEYKELSNMLRAGVGSLAGDQKEGGKAVQMPPKPPARPEAADGQAAVDGRAAPGDRRRGRPSLGSEMCDGDDMMTGMPSQGPKEFYG